MEFVYYAVPCVETTFPIRFPFTIISGIIVTTSGSRRNQLLRVCRTLCIEPHYKILGLSENGAEGQ
jgi:hypothetical protein